MVKLIFHVAIIFLMIVGCIGPREKFITWTASLNHLLLDLYYEAYSLDEFHPQKIKAMWDEKVPKYSYLKQGTLERHLYDLRNHYWNVWQNRSGTEREQLEDSLANIYKDTDNGHPQHEKRIFEELLKIHPDYRKDYELTRYVVHQWYKLLTPPGKEIMAKHVDWTPQRKADLLHIEEQVRLGEGQKYNRIRERWLKMHENLNVEEHSLSDYAYRLRKRDEYKPSAVEKFRAELKYKSLFPPVADETQIGVPVQKVKRLRWTDQLNADLLHISNEVRGSAVNFGAAIKDRWDRMEKNLTYLTREALIARIVNLNKTGYEPDPDNVQDAKRRYEVLPPIPAKLFSRRIGKRKGQQLEIREGKLLSQEHQNAPFSPGFELTPEQMSLFQQDMEDLNKTCAEHAHYRHHNFYYGSSSHTPIDQGPFGSLPDTPHPQHHQWYPGESSSHIPTDQASSSTQPHFQNPYDHHPWASSSHFSTDQGSFGSLPDTPHPQHHQWYPGSSSNHSQHPPQ